jgi:hypothetical protein
MNADRDGLVQSPMACAHLVIEGNHLYMSHRSLWYPAGWLLMRGCIEPAGGQLLYTCQLCQQGVELIPPRGVLCKQGSQVLCAAQLCVSKLLQVELGCSAYSNYSCKTSCGASRGR